MIGLKGWGKYPVSEKMAQEVLSLPVHPKLSEEELNYIVERIREACQ
jgi:UDP-2-acetamido-2-deoxy-ribo-hexuluronate aminotransferase